LIVFLILIDENTATEDDLSPYEYAPKEFKTNIRNMDRHYFDDDGMLEKNFYEEKWEKLIDDIRHSHRFFNPNAKAFLDSIFAFLSIDNLLKPECVRIIFKGVPLYRARSASTYGEIKRIAAAPASQTNTKRQSQ